MESSETFKVKMDILPPSSSPSTVSHHEAHSFSAWLAIDSNIHWTKNEPDPENGRFKFSGFENRFELRRLECEKHWSDVEEQVKKLEGKGLIVPGKIFWMASEHTRFLAAAYTWTYFMSLRASMRRIVVIIADDETQRDILLNEIRSRISPWQALYRQVIKLSRELPPDQMTSKIEALLKFNVCIIPSMRELLWTRVRGNFKRLLRATTLNQSTDDAPGEDILLDPIFSGDKIVSPTSLTKWIDFWDWQVKLSSSVILAVMFIYAFISRLGKRSKDIMFVTTAVLLLLYTIPLLSLRSFAKLLDWGQKIRNKSICIKKLVQLHEKLVKCLVKLLDRNMDKNEDNFLLQKLFVVRQEILVLVEELEGFYWYPRVESAGELVGRIQEKIALFVLMAEHRALKAKLNSLQEASSTVTSPGSTVVRSSSI